ncbi:MAG TPA: RND family transporter [Alphaproteobacteria bacterium]|nr:RND family transporter [Alphaproteobacteria bacterium]HIB55620.1 RND family transporter [Alphaproteobacteria bacterium]HIN92698.1 RND family transporter [Alphaproteobacteria bacterium]
MAEITSKGTAGVDYAYGRWIVRNRWVVLVLSIIAFAIAASGVRFLTMNPDARVFFSEDNPHLVALEQLENTYVKAENLLFILAPQDGEVFTRRTLEAVEWLTEKCWQTPYSTRVDSISNFQHTRADGDDLVVRDLIQNAAQFSDEDVSMVRAIALDRPALAGRLLSHKAHVTAVQVLVIKPEKSLNEVPEIMVFARDLREQFQAKYPNIDVYLNGSVAINMAFAEIPLQELKKLLPLMFLLILVIIGISTRTTWGTIATFLVIFMSVFIALGVAGWAGAVLVPSSEIAPIIILTLSVAHSVHILSSMRLSMQGGLGKHDALVEALRINMAPVFITSITTTIGFMCMNFSDAPPFRLLGNIVATGVMVAFVLSITLLPSLVSILPARVAQRNGIGSRVMDRLAGFVVMHREKLFWGTGAAIVVLALGILRIDLDDNFLKYFDHSVPIRITSDFTESNLNGLQMLQYSVPARDEGGIADPDYLTKLEAFGRWFKSQPKVTHVAAITEVFKRLNESMNGDDPDFYRLPEERDLAAQYLLLYEMSLPYGLDLNNQINVRKSASQLMVSVKEISSKEIRQLDARAQVWLSENMPGAHAPGTGLSVVFSYISGRNINSMLAGSITALVVISMILIFALRSLKMGLISLIPNLFPAAMAFGLWGYVQGNVGLAIAIVLAMTLGIVVDDTVHFLSKYLRARREHGMDAVEATRYAFRTVGVALWITSITLVTGFGALSISSFKVNSDMGLLSGITIAFALLADFLFLPPLLMKLDRART